MKQKDSKNSKKVTKRPRKANFHQIDEEAIQSNHVGKNHSINQNDDKNNDKKNNKKEKEGGRMELRCNRCKIHGKLNIIKGN